VGAAAGALLGSRLLGLLEHPALLLHPPGGWLYYFTNKTIVGGFLGGLVGVELALSNFFALLFAIGEVRRNGPLGLVFPGFCCCPLGRVLVGRAEELAAAFLGRNFIQH
jgi:hypothetical protein